MSPDIGFSSGADRWIEISPELLAPMTLGAAESGSIHIEHLDLILDKVVAAVTAVLCGARQPVRRSLMSMAIHGILLL